MQAPTRCSVIFQTCASRPVSQGISGGRTSSTVENEAGKGATKLAHFKRSKSEKILQIARKVSSQTESSSTGQEILRGIRRTNCVMKSPTASAPKRDDPSSPLGTSDPARNGGHRPARHRKGADGILRCPEGRFRHGTAPADATLCPCTLALHRGNDPS